MGWKAQEWIKVKPALVDRYVSWFHPYQHVIISLPSFSTKTRSVWYQYRNYTRKFNDRKSNWNFWKIVQEKVSINDNVLAGIWVFFGIIAWHVVELLKQKFWIWNKRFTFSWTASCLPDGFLWWKKHCKWKCLKR